jgi:hypothetical protein
MLPDVYDPQQLNRYAYVSSNPYRYFDSQGTYQRDVHYYLTYSLAISAGFSQEFSTIRYSTNDAELIASADQSVDEGISNPKLGFLTKYNHFQSRDSARERVNRAIQSHNLQEFGEALHTFQDSFSHEGLSPMEHAKLGTAPDITKNDPQKAYNMAFQTFIYLGQYNGLSTKEILTRWNDGVSDQVLKIVSAERRGQISKDRQRALTGPKISAKGKYKPV